jgi:predicted DNA-binding transcriptional regulator AlpA
MIKRTYEDDDLIPRKIAVRYLGITGTCFDKWRRNGSVASPITAQGGYPRWRFKDIRALKDTLTKAGVLPLNAAPVEIGNPKTPDDAMATRADCARFAGVGLATWDRWVSKGKAPAPVRVGNYAPHWRVGDIRDFYKIGGTTSIECESPVKEKSHAE